MARKNIVLILSLLLLGISVRGGAQTRKIYPFMPKEDLQFQVFYNLGPLWVYAGDVNLKTNITTFHHIKSFHFVATGHSLKKYAFIFKLKDYYQSITSIKGFKPLFYEKKTLEGGYYIHNIYRFHWNKGKVNVHTEATRHPAKDTVLSLNNSLYDVLSATYYLRIINPDSLTVGDTLSMPLIVDGKKVTYRIIFAGKGKMIHKKEKIICNVYKAVITSSTFFSSTNPLVVFVTDDKNRYPVFVEANIIVGSIKVFLLPYLDYNPRFRKHKRK